MQKSSAKSDEVRIIKSKFRFSIFEKPSNWKLPNLENSVSTTKRVPLSFFCFGFLRESFLVAILSRFIWLPSNSGISTIRHDGVSLVEFAAFVKEKLGSNGVRYVDTGRPVHKVAVGGGSCSGSLKDVFAAGCDTFVTADVKYDSFLDAKALGLNLIDAGHYPTENLVCPVLVDWLKTDFPQVEVLLSKHKEVFNYL